MRGNRVLFYLNCLIAVALVAFAGAFYWFAWRPQAQASGTVAANVAAPVEITRDGYGVPSIRAKSLDDLFFAQGFTHAQDRLFQMDLTRRQASGELAEVFGAGSLQSDLDARRLGLRRLAELHAKALPAEERAALAAYARGVNHFVETHADRLPLEFTLLGYAPAPWTVADSMTVVMGMARLLSESWRNEVLKQTMLETGDRELVEELFPARSGAEPQLGSNAWVVSGNLTKSGKPILANDPHLPLSLPGIWYQNELSAPGFHATGVSLPGLPAVVIGRNDRIAWGMTNLQFDVQDLFLERADLAQGVVLANGQAVPLSRGVEGIRVRGAGVVTAPVAATRHGVVITEAPAGAQLALRWMAAEPGGVRFPLVALNRAGSWSEFRDALRQWTVPAQNFVYADAEGNIGYQVAGRLPEREHDGSVPVDGTADANEWTGVIPFEDLPSAYNPPSGVLVTANQNPFAANFAHRVAGNFAPPDRALQIEARLRAKSAKGKLTAEDMVAIERDLYSAFHHSLARELAAAAKDRGGANRRVTEAAAALNQWNGQMSASSSAALITTLAWGHLRQAIVDRAAPNPAGAQPRNYDLPMSTAVAERLLRERPAKWFANFDDVLLRALLDAVREAEKEQGSSVGAWRLGAHQRVTLASPVLGNVRYLSRSFARWLRLGPVEMGGAPVTVSQHTRRDGQVIAPSMRIVVDWGGDSRVTLSTGQSGQAFSPHYRDQWGDYVGGQGRALGTAAGGDVLRLKQ